MAQQSWDVIISDIDLIIVVKDSIEDSVKRAFYGHGGGIKQ